MRFVLALGVAASGCAANAEAPPDPCPAGEVTFLAPALDATMPPPAVDVRLTVTDYTTIEIDLGDASSRTYFPSGAITVDQAEVLSARFAMLPPGTAFTVNVNRACPTDDAHVTHVPVGHWRFRTGS